MSMISSTTRSRRTAGGELRRPLLEDAEDLAQVRAGAGRRLAPGAEPRRQLRHDAQVVAPVGRRQVRGVRAPPAPRPGRVTARRARPRSSSSPRATSVGSPWRIEDRVEHALTRAEVVVERRDVALSGRLDDLPDRDLVEPAPREQPLRLAEQPFLGGGGVAGHGRSRVPRQATAGAERALRDDRRPLDVGQRLRERAELRLAPARGSGRSSACGPCRTRGITLSPKSSRHGEHLFVVHALDRQTEHELVHADVAPRARSARTPRRACRSSM